MSLPIANKILEIESHQMLEGTLSAHGISTASWGENDSKTSGDLYEELQAGESALFMAADGLQKYCSTIKVDVFHSVGSRLLRLTEAVQYNCVTGTWRHRGLRNSLSEKRRALQGEEPGEAAVRGLYEELRGPDEEVRVTDPLSLHLTAHKLHPPQAERNYAGLLSVNETHYFVAQLRPEEYDPRGYMERNTDDQGRPVRETYFHWETVA
jgi:hypothetical protein